MRKTLPKNPIRSKTELSKHLSHNGNYKKILDKINKIKRNFPKYYSNHTSSNRDERKFIRKPKGDLREINYLINHRILKKYDDFIPCFIYGGISKRNYIQAIDPHCSKEKRTFIKLDVERFFDQIDYEKVIKTLIHTVGCSYEGAKSIAELCCVPESEYYDINMKKVIPRGFSTSSRLAVLSSLDFFMMLNYKMKKYFKGLQPKISVFVDDISISFQNTSDEKISLFLEDVAILEGKYNIYLKKEKQDIIKNTNDIELLGMRIYNGKMYFGDKTRKKYEEVTRKYDLGDKSRKTQNSVDGYSNLEKYVRKVEKEKDLVGKAKD